jgi:hypothetical protein
VRVAGYEGLNLYYGDLHTHCNVGIAYGTAEEAFQNARTQLDFSTVTAQTSWADMPEPQGYLEPIVAYHVEGFRRAAELWPHLQEVTEAINQDGRFVSFLSFEWHNARHGDHVILYRGGRGEILRAQSLEAMRAELRRLAGEGMQTFLVPHHIAYVTGYRGIHWPDFQPEFTPVVELLSMHGVSESDEAPSPYYHDMGPRDGRNTIQAGLRLGKVFGVVGSTDHHSAQPGTYGSGRAAVWAPALTRAAIWEAIAARRTYAVTGDRIALQFSLNGHPMGSVLPPGEVREIEVSVAGGDALDYVEVLHNNHRIHRWDLLDAAPPRPDEPVKVLLEIGWGQYGIEVDWEGELEIVEGSLLGVEPHFRGADILSPQAAHARSHAFSGWELQGNRVLFHTRTWGNKNPTTPGTQGICLEIQAHAATRLRGRLNGRPIAVDLNALRESSQASFLGGFLSPAYKFHRAVPRSRRVCHTTCRHVGSGKGQDQYYVRVRQLNHQWAWSSPIWVQGC